MQSKNELGYSFPVYNGELLSWSLDLTDRDEKEGCPRLKAVLAEMDLERLKKERREHFWASFDRVFGHNARKVLILIEAEIASR